MRPLAENGEIRFVDEVLHAGSAAHGHLHHLIALTAKAGAAGGESRDLADALAQLASLYGRFPGLVDHAANTTQDDNLRLFLIRSGTAFAVERALLARLTMLAGPSPSTPGDARCTAAIEALRNSLDLLGHSERQGCAAAAALALLADWATIRPMLECAAAMLAVNYNSSMIAQLDEIENAAAILWQSERTARAAKFGMSQLLMQHHSFWDLLAARCAARNASLVS